jgi:DnaB-like helicase N terminal domain
VDDDLINRVERALLGALITDPGLVPRLEYLERHEFADDRHRAVYEAIRSLPDATAPSAGSRIAAIARAAGLRVSEEYVHELAASCPDPRHGTAYGLRLVQVALYRRMSENADAIGAEAALHEHEARVVEAGANGGQQALDAARYLGLVAAALRRHAAPLVPTTSATAVRSSAASPDRPASDQELREEQALTALLQQHRESDQILAFLPAAAFTSPERQEIFRAIRRLRQADQPVDELTVSWELAIGDSSSQRYGNSDVASGAYTTVMRLASANDPGQSPPKEARGLLSQLDRRTAPDRQPARHAQSGQAPGQASPSPAAGLSATQPPEAAGPQQGREPRR